MSEKIGDGETDLLTENLCNLLALASAPDIPPSRLRTELHDRGDADILPAEPASRGIVSAVRGIAFFRVAQNSS